MMKRSGAAVAMLAAAGLVVPPSAVATDAVVDRPAGGTSGVVAAPSAEFVPCEEAPLAALGVECAQIEAPLDHDDPDGESVGLAVARLPASAADDDRLGTLVVHPGGPGASGRVALATVAQLMPEQIRARYDLVGVDTRGTGASTPTLTCDPGYFQDAPDPVVGSISEEMELLDRARGYTSACAESGNELVHHMDAESQAHDLDAVRDALGEARISYVGYGYGGYLGAVYASEYPDRLDRTVLDSTIRPDGRWFVHYLWQAAGFDERAGEFFAWIAQHDDAYGLGSDAAQVEAAYYELRDSASDEPIGGTIGPFELVTTVETIGWERNFWPLIAEGLSGVIAHDDPTYLELLHEQLSAHHDDSTYAPYIAAHCADGTWPSHWSLWSIVGRATHRTSPFIAWNNIWYVAPCESWSVESEGYRIDTDGLTDALVVHASDDAAMSVLGGYAMHREIASSRMVVVDGGRDSSVAMMGREACVEEVVVDYLVNGTLPEQQQGADVVCTATAPDPTPLDGSAEAMNSLSSVALAR